LPTGPVYRGRGIRATLKLPISLLGFVDRAGEIVYIFVIMVGLFRFLVVVFIIYVAYLIIRFFRALTRPRTAPKPRAEIQGLMVKDDVCNTYIPREEAIREIRDGREHFYCSEECRRKARERG
jgi:uncharacterized protein